MGRYNARKSKKHQMAMPEVPIELPAGAAISAYEGALVSFMATVARIPHQHMIKEMASGERFSYLDLDGGRQVVAYHRGQEMPEEGESRRFVGRVGVLRGPGKAGRGEWVEVYVMLA